LPRSSLIIDWPVGTVLSGESVIHEGARGVALFAPGTFRIDVRPWRDTVSIAVRNLSPVKLNMRAPERDRKVIFNGDHVASSTGQATKRHDVRFDLGTELEVRAIFTLDRSEAPGLIRVVAQALIIPINPEAVTRA
jgi:hypothetical protein